MPSGDYQSVNELIGWLLNVKGLSPAARHSMLSYFDNPVRLFEADETEIRRVPHIRIENISELQKSKRSYDFISERKKLREKDISLITLFDENYPKSLRFIHDPPVGLFIAGKLPDDSFPKLSIIGSRDCTEYGRLAAEKFGRELAENDIVVVSGMARGLDSCGHIGALSGGGKTIAVLGCGVDVCYPPENRGLMKRITENGCCLSEYPPGAQPSRHFFPERNRIISGMSLGVIVIEAGEKSGTSITVNQAIDQGREVFALPGPIFSKASSGTNRMIQEGACLLQTTDDILNVLNLRENRKIAENERITRKEKVVLSLAPDEKLVYDCIAFSPITIEEIIDKTHTPFQELIYALTKLEMDGHIKKLPGQQYIRFE